MLLLAANRARRACWPMPPASPFSCAQITLADQLFRRLLVSPSTHRAMRLPAASSSISSASARTAPSSTASLAASKMLATQAARPTQSNMPLRSAQARVLRPPPRSFARRELQAAALLALPPPRPSLPPTVLAARRVVVPRRQPTPRTLLPH